MTRPEQLQPVQLFTAGSIIIPNLVIVTLERDASGNFRLLPPKSGKFTLEERSTASVQRFASDVKAFTALADIRFITLSAGQESGRFPPGPRAFKIETILQLVPGLQVEIVNTKCVDYWVGRSDPCLPEPSGTHSSKKWLNAETRAIEAAAFTALHADVPRYFPNGVIVESRVLPAGTELVVPIEICESDAWVGGRRIPIAALSANRRAAIGGARNG